MASTSTRASSALLAVALLVGAPGLARAQDRASAEELFQLGKGAMARQDYLKACNYFQASLNADFALGTLLNLAICHEQAGKIASAWGEYRTLEDRSRRATPPQAERAQFAHDHAEALRPRLSRVRIVLSPEAKAIAALVVKIDGVPAQPELFEAGVPVDPGKRKITASAPDREEWSDMLAVDDEKLTLQMTIPGLKQGARPAAGGGLDVDRIAAERSQRTVGFIVGGIGLAALTGGVVFGVLAIGAADDATKCTRPCYRLSDDGKTPNPELTDAENAYSRANTFGWISNIGVVAGAIGVGAGTYLVLTAGRSSAKPAATRLRFAPAPVLAGGMLTVGADL